MAHFLWDTRYTHIRTNMHTKSSNTPRATDTYSEIYKNTQTHMDKQTHQDIDIHRQTNTHTDPYTQIPKNTLENSFEK